MSRGHGSRLGARATYHKIPITPSKRARRRLVSDALPALFSDMPQQTASPGFVPAGSLLLQTLSPFKAILNTVLSLRGAGRLTAAIGASMSYDPPFVGIPLQSSYQYPTTNPLNHTPVF